jgi:glycosyltransferase involved in cell wall biosynthesis
MKVALVHDYFTQRGGAERVAAHLASLYADSLLYTSVLDIDAAPDMVDRERIRTTSLQRLRRARLPLRSLAPVMPGAFASLDLGSPDVVLSSSSAFAHHVRTPSDAVQICYCHTPAPFLWSSQRYFERSRLSGLLAAPGLALMRRRDRAAAARVDVFVANSRFTAERMRRIYDRNARVIHPPIDTARFRPTTERSGRFLTVSRLRPHKAIDLVITAANVLGLPLDVLGDGSDRPRLEAMAGPTVRFLGRRSDAEVAEAMARCAALVVPGVEDFGMVIAEVQAAGRPPVALDAGGAPEIIRDGVTGFLACEQSAAAIGAAMLRSQREELDTAALVASAQRFDVAVFDSSIRALVDEVLNARARSLPALREQTAATALPT